jgi:flagellar biosynthesis/type III secretory pathway chaperone
MNPGRPGSDPISGLLAALRDERAALEADETSRLPELAARKSELLHACAAFVSAGVEPRRRAALRAALAEARRMNDHNALLLAPRLASVRARLAVLGRRNNATVYGADGVARSGFGALRRGYAAT